MSYKIAKGRGPLKNGGRTYHEGDAVTLKPEQAVHLLKCGTVEEVFEGKTSVICIGKTKKGNACKKSVVEGSEFCKSHQKQAEVE